MDTDLDYIARRSLSLIDETAEFIRKERAEWSLNDLKHKEDKSLVTSIDVATEERLVEGLSKILPGSAFLAEEGFSERPDADWMWVIDPIDGTTNFVHNFPMYCISVALLKEGKPVLGVISEISSREVFWAHEGKEGAFLNDRPMRVSQAPTVRESILATGFPSTAFPKLDEYLEKFRTFMTSSHGVRRLGSAAMDLAYVASGRCDGFFEYELKPWDVAAGAYLVQKAGGMVTDFSGGDDFIFGREILASNAIIHKEFQHYFNSHS